MARPGIRKGRFESGAVGCESGHYSVTIRMCLCYIHALPEFITSFRMKTPISHELL